MWRGISQVVFLYQHYHIVMKHIDNDKYEVLRCDTMQRRSRGKLQWKGGEKTMRIPTAQLRARSTLGGERMEQFACYLDPATRDIAYKLMQQYPWLGKSMLGRAAIEFYLDHADRYGIDPHTLKPVVSTQSGQER